MFYIEAGIQRWRQSLLASEALRAEHVDELEDHLRSEFENLRELTRAPALSEEEIFLIALRRLGRADQLAVEYAKADPNAVWRRRWMWMLGGYIGIGFAIYLVAIFASVGTFLVSRQSLASGCRLALYFVANGLGILGMVALARWISRAPWVSRLRAAYASKLLTATGLVVFTLATIALRFAILPLSRAVVLPSMSGVMAAAKPSFLTYSQMPLLLAPFLLLAILVWRDRERLRQESALASNNEAG